MGAKGLESKSRVGASGAGNELREIEAVVLFACGDNDGRAEAQGPSLEWDGPWAR